MKSHRNASCDATLKNYCKTAVNKIHIFFFNVPYYGKKEAIISCTVLYVASDVFLNMLEYCDEHIEHQSARHIFKIAYFIDFSSHYFTFFRIILLRSIVSFQVFFFFNFPLFSLQPCIFSLQSSTIFFAEFYLFYLFMNIFFFL